MKELVWQSVKNVVKKYFGEQEVEPIQDTAETLESKVEKVRAAG